MAKAIWQNKVIAESNNTIDLEGNVYFPPEALRKEYFQDSATTSQCPWKGTANYYNVVVGDDVNKDAAWVYRTPKDAAKEIKNHVAFWRGVQVSK